ncbi:hypothetical protein NDU88_000323 [Pleurodeles waltl]|uniref:Uncharacterized protein n=1 Tax=Pleurodeles waltl TaxID=8319 RepID=A0AAV7S6R7_PLEWA|nr:hypothetical protein NDU88_000323 [Pleurodeles waltl]
MKSGLGVHSKLAKMAQSVASTDIPQPKDPEPDSTLEFKQLILKGNRLITEKIDGVAITVALLRQDMDKMHDLIAELSNRVDDTTDTLETLSRQLMDQEKQLQRQEGYESQDLSDEAGITALLEEGGLSRVPAEMCEILNNLIEETDIKWAIKNMSTGKAPPRNDGLPVKFYQTYKDLVSTPLLAMYREAMGIGILPAALHEANVVVLGKDPLASESIRTLSMINVDAKILGETLACHLVKVSDTIINMDQARFVGGNMTPTKFRRHSLS